jgi:hypothetical protein
LARIRAKRNSGAGPLDFLAGTLEEAENRSSGKYRIPTIYFSEPSPLPVTACAGVVRSWGMSSKTWIARTAEVIADKEVASVVVRLMMALNDIAMANEGLGEWTFGQERKKLARQNGGRLYYGRMLMAHVYEALSIIKDIQDNPKLRALVDACDPETRLSFDAVAVFLTTSDTICSYASETTLHFTMTINLQCGRLNRSITNSPSTFPPIRSDMILWIGTSNLAI